MQVTTPPIGTAGVRHRRRRPAVIHTRIEHVDLRPAPGRVATLLGASALARARSSSRSAYQDRGIGAAPSCHGQAGHARRLRGPPPRSGRAVTRGRGRQLPPVEPDVRSRTISRRSLCHCSPQGCKNLRMSEPKTYDQAPGNVLQNMYLKSRLKKWAMRGMRFIEMGAGNGNISNILLEAGLNGIGFDLSEKACANNSRRNEFYLSQQQYAVRNSNFLEYDGDSVDIIISSHVIEHLPEEDVDLFFKKSSSVLKAGGRIISIVPAGMKYWGIEDETSGHFRRYEYEDFQILSEKFNLKSTHLAGLTYPLSNILLGLSDSLVRKHEGWKTQLSMQERTVLSSSGVKQVKYKTVYPYYFRYLINETTMYPFFLLQLMTARNPKCMVLYSEVAKP